MSWLKEDKLILKLSKLSLDEEAKNIIKNLNIEKINWDYFFNASKERGVFGLVYYHLKNEAEAVPYNIEKKFQDLYSENASRNLILLKEFQEVLKVLKDKEIPVIVLKGVYLLENIYKNIALRGMSDIDILIRKGYLEKFNNTVKKIGFTTPQDFKRYLNLADSPYLNTIVYQKKRGKISVFLHLHWHIINSTIPMFEEVIKYINMHKIWEQALPVKITGIDVLSLSSHHQIIYLCLHSFYHSLDRNILLCDISEFINANKDKIDWDLLLKDSFHFKLNRIVYSILYLAKSLLNTEIPHYVLSSLKPPCLSYGERKFINLVLDNAQFPKLSVISYLFMLSKLNKKLKFLIKTFFPKETVLEQRFSLSSNKSNFLRKIFRIGRGLKEVLVILIRLFF